MARNVNSAVLVGLVPITTFMCNKSCTDEERWALQALLESGDIGAVNSVGLSVKILDGRTYVGRDTELPLVHQGYLLPR